MSASKVFLATLTFAAVLVASSAQGAAFTVSSDEVWDGVNNPHEADGVTLAVVSGVATYTIPFAMTVDPGVNIFLKDPNAADANNNQAITWNFTGASNSGLTFGDTSSTIDTGKGLRSGEQRLFTLNMNNNPIAGSVAGAGRIVSRFHVQDFLADDAVPASTASSLSFGVTINSMNNVSLGTLDTTWFDTGTSPLTVNAHGTVDIDNLANGDLSAGGGSGNAINITGRSLTIGNINGQAVRVASAPNTSNVNLRGLSQPTNSTGNFVGNAAADNTITLDGFINLTGKRTELDNGGGNVTLNTVKATLTDTFFYAPNTTNVANAGIFTVNVGRTDAPFTEAQLFINNSTTAFPDTKNVVNFNVFHDGIGPAAVAWLNNASGSFNGDANWNPGVAPNSSNTAATIGSAITAPQTIFMNTAAKAKSLTFDTASKVALAGTAELTLESNSGNAGLSALQGNHEIQVPVTLGTNTDASAAAGASIDVNGVLNLNGKTLNTSGAGTVNLNNSVTGVGAVNNTGTLGTGGATSLAGTLTSTGTLAIDIGGTGVNFFDSWAVTGAATLSGTLSVDAVGGFTPTGSFTVLTASSVSAASLTLGGPDAGLFTLIKNANSLVLQAGGGGAVAGDYNGNGTVDAADYVLWREQDGDNVTPGSGADGDGNGVVNAADHAFWKARFGNTAASGSGTSVGAIPEPASAMLVLLAGLMLAIGGRRRS